MRFVHTADIHWGIIPDPDKPWGKIRANAVRDVPRRILDVCREEGADCLLVAGDLFHRPPGREELSELDALFASVPSLHVALIAGNRDRVEKNAALRSFRWSGNVHWILEEDLGKVYFEDIHTEVYGMSYHRKGYPDPDLQRLVPQGEAGDGEAEGGDLQRPIRLLLLHGGDARHLPFSSEELSRLPYDYIALGHRHNPEILLPGKAVYAGTPEPLGIEETGQHGVYVGEIHPLTHRLLSLSFRPLSDLSYIPLSIQVTPETEEKDFVAQVSREIRRQGIQNIYQIRITGRRDPGVHFRLDALSGRGQGRGEEDFRILELCDATEPAYDFAALYREHPADLLGFYIRAMHREEEAMSYVEKRALYYGIDALLRSQDGEKD